MNKKSIRNEIIARRDALSLQERKEKSEKIKEYVLAQEPVQQADVIFGFLNFGSEVSMKPLLEKLLHDGKTIYVPYTEKGNPEMKVLKLHSYDDLELGNYGILTPKEENRVWGEKEKIDVIFVPGVAFSPDGYRIGYGAGYYDRFIQSLPQKPYKLGIGYSLQRVSSIPIEDHDQPIDALITEDGVYIPERSTSI